MPLSEAESALLTSIGAPLPDPPETPAPAPAPEVKPEVIPEPAPDPAPASADQPEETVDEGYKRLQTRYDAAVAKLKATLPAEEFKKWQAEKREKVREQQKAKEQPKPETPPAYSIEEIAETARLAARQGSEEAYMETQIRIAHAAETDSAKQAVSQFVQENSVTPELLNAAIQEVAQYNIDIQSLGGPTAAARAILKEIRSSLLNSEFDRRLTTEKAKAAEQVKAAAGVSQPAAGAAPAPGTPTKEQDLISRFQKFAPPKISELGKT